MLLDRFRRLLQDQQQLFGDLFRKVIRVPLRQQVVQRGRRRVLIQHRAAIREQFDDIEALCTRVMVIGQGKILSDGTLEALRARVTTERLLIVDLMDEDWEVSDPDAAVVHREDRRVTLSFDPGRVPAATLIGRIAATHAIRDLFVENPPIEEIIARLYREDRP